MTQERWKLTGSGPESYERYQVPSVFEPLARLFLQRVPLQPGQRVLDVACGTGVIVRHAAPILGSAGHLVGVDLNSNMLDVARQHAPTNGPSVEWRQGDVASLPCSSSEFDVVICQQGLQFFPDKSGALREMYRVLKPGGRVAICVWRRVEHSPCHLAIAEVLLGFSLAFFRFWGFEASGEWAPRSIIAAGTLAVAVLLQIVALVRSLRLEDDDPNEYRKTVKWFTASAVVLLIGLLIATAVFAGTPEPK